MNPITEGSLLWEPSESVKANANLTHYMQWLRQTRGLVFQTYAELRQWSVTEAADFWQSIWDYGGVIASQPPTAILADRRMPGAQWFVGARLNYAENFFARPHPADQPAILYKAEDEPARALGWDALYAQTAALAAALQKMGVQPGDRVAAYLPNIPEAIVALLAVAALGAVWSSCSPDFGSRSVLDRFQQIEPKILISVDGYVYNGKPFDRLEVVAELQAGLPTLQHTIVVPRLHPNGDLSSLRATRAWADVAAETPPETALRFFQAPFDHPLWVLYSSGTTGLPKPIVQGHGGILLEHLKELILHLDIKPGDRFFWYTSTGWMMWNFLVGGLLTGSTIVLYDGSPAYPSLNALWQLSAETGITYFGASAAFIHACLKADIRPAHVYDLSRIRAVGSTGSPLSAAGFQWVYTYVNSDLALESVSGGTDLCTAFVGGCRLLPIYAGGIEGGDLGADVRAFNMDGEALVGIPGGEAQHLFVPSMPLYFWNDPDNQRYLGSYFEMYPGVWRHGDWIKFNARGGCVIYGRSDSTINRQGIRMGTSELYQAVEAIPEILDSLVIDLELLGRESYLPLFVVLRQGVMLDAALKARIKHKIRQDLSPRHVPDDIIAIPQVPYTLSGKKMEVPIRRILLGQAVEKAANPGAMRNPEALPYFVALAQQLQTGPTVPNPPA